MNKKIILCLYALLIIIFLSFVSAECNDSDGGINYYTRGHLVGTNKWGDQIDMLESCQGGSILAEGFCESGYATGSLYDCSQEGKICSDGKCTTDDSFCEDDEPGKSIEVKGAIRFKNGGEITNAEDGCSVALDTPNLLYEWYCDGTTAKFDEVHCDELNMFCSDGACVSCTDSDGGKNYDEPGSTKDLGGTETDSCLDEATLQEYYCDSNGQRQSETVKCSDQGKICSGGKCIVNPCQDNEPQKDIAVRGTVMYNGQELKDGCSNAADTPDLLYEWYCDGSVAKNDEIHCDELGLKCINGKCLDKSQISCEDSDPHNDISLKGQITMAGEVVAEDGCYDEATLVQINCDGNDQVSYDAYYCSKDGKFCSEGVCKTCPAGTIWGGGRCGVPDHDADGIPDLGEDKCLDTSPGDAINAEGCSCEQGAEEVYIENAEKGMPVLKSCEDLKNLPWNEACSDDLASHCCNSIKDQDEFLTDCGGNDCSSCAGVCNKIVDGGDLDILFVPISYSSSTDASVINNLDEWKSRAESEATKLTSTPPFDTGQVTVWRLDLFNINPDFQNKLALNELGFFNKLDLKLFKKSEYSALCPGIDLISFLPSTSERSFAQKGEGINVVYKEGPEVNAITHETGHSFCGLDDEYQEEVGPIGNLVDLIYSENSINCDHAPQTWIHADGTTELKCKWWVQFPDAGCIPGCMYSNSWYRPKSDFEDSMMFSNMQVGSADYGKGTWNQVGYKTCKDLVEKYDKI